MSLKYCLFLLAVIVIFIIIRIFYLQSRVWYLQRMRKRWRAHVTNSDDAKHIQHEEMPKFKRVLLEAQVGIEKISWARTQPTGYGFVNHPNLPLIENLCVSDQEIAKIANAKIGEAIGAYRLRRNNTMNPIYWLISLWHLPQSVAGSIGINKNAWPVRTFQLIYQLAVVDGFLLKAWDFWQKASK